MRLRRQVQRRLAAFASGDRDGLLLITGASGIGKSRILEDARDALGATLVRVDPADADWPLSGISTLLSSLGDRRAAEFGGRFDLRSTHPDDVFAAARDLLSLLRGLGLAPTLLLVDDIDRMDDASRALIRAMAPRLASTGVRIVATRRDDGPAVGLAGVDILRLEPLDDDDAYELLCSAADSRTDEGTLRILVRQSAGNPGALLEALRSLTGEQLRGREPLVLPLRRVRRPRNALDDVDPGWHPALELIALSPHLPIAMLHAAGIARETVDELLGTGLLVSQGQGVRLASALRRSAVVWSLERPERTRRHRRLAQAAAATGVHWALAWHESFLAADPSGPALLTAAIGLARELDVASAIELSERALRLCPPGEDELPLILGLASAFARAGEPGLASRILLYARTASAPPEVAMRVAGIRADVHYAQSHRVPMEEIEGAVGMYADAAPDDCGALLTAAAALHLDRGELAPARTLLAQAGTFLVGARAPTIAFHAAVTDFAAALEGIPVRLPDGPETLDDPDEDPMVAHGRRLVLARALTYAEQYDQARQTLAVVLRVVGDNDLDLIEVTRYLAASNEIRAGDYARAREIAERWIDAAPHRPRRASRVLLEAWLARAEGRADDERRLIELALQRSAEEGDQTMTASVLAVAGGVALVAGDTEEAVRMLRLADLASSGIPNPAITRHGADLVHALVRSGRMREAETVATGLLTRRRDRGSRWLTLAAARVVALLAPDDAAPARFDEAVAGFGPDDSRIELGKLLLGRAEFEARTGRVREQAATLAAATAAFEQAGAHAWAPVTTPAPAPPTAASTRPFVDLTPDELEVARLVQRGYRNKEIAQALYISLRTVELRMTRIFRKTGASSRAQLVALLAGSS